MFATFLLCTRSTLKLLLPCPPPLEEPRILLHLLMLLFSAVWDAQVALAGLLGTADDWLRPASARAPCRSFSSCPRARSCLPQPAPAWGTGGWKTCLCRGSAACSCPSRRQEISCLGFPQSHQAGGRPGASGMPQVEAGGCQPLGPGAPGAAAEQRCSCRGWPRRCLSCD